MDAIFCEYGQRSRKSVKDLFDTRAGKKDSSIGEIIANYRSHIRFNFLVILPLCLLVFCMGENCSKIPIGSFIGSFAYATLFMNPDLDLVHQIRLFSIRGLCTLPFRLYSKLFKHRGVSHHFLLGTLSRLLWAFGIYLVVFYLLYENGDPYRSFFRYFSQHKTALYYGLSGVFVADMGHLIKDGLRKKKGRQ